MIKCHNDLSEYNFSYALGIDIYKLTRNLPQKESMKII